VKTAGSRVRAITIDSPRPPVKRVVVLGAGFAGMSLAHRLEQRRDLDVTIVDRNDYTLFTPMLPEVASGSIEPRHIAQPLRAALRRARFIIGDVTEVDFTQREVSLDGTLDGIPRRVAFDALVIALGACSSTHGIPGADDHSFALKTVDDATALRSRIVRMLEIAVSTADVDERRSALTFVVVGGGFTGVEAAGELRGYLRSMRRFYPGIRIGEIQLVLVAGSARLLEQLPARFGSRAQRMFARRDINVVLSDDVAAVDAGGLTLKSGKRFESQTVVWSAGVRPSPLVETLAVAQSKHHAARANSDFSVPGHDDVWAIGDCAQIPKRRGGFYPQTAQDAVREGTLLAHNIVAALHGRKTRTFRYRSPGMMASLGHREGLAELGPGLLLGGMPAWLLWRAYYLTRLPGAARKVRVALDWTLGLFFPGDIVSIR
jgi:NADH dehydrogenase